MGHARNMGAREIEFSNMHAPDDGIYGVERRFCVFIHHQDTIRFFWHHPTFERSLLTLKGDSVVG
jgi:hypothetical protein